MGASDSTHERVRRVTVVELPIRSFTATTKEDAMAISHARPGEVVDLVLGKKLAGATTTAR